MEAFTWFIGKFYYWLAVIIGVSLVVMAISGSLLGLAYLSLVGWSKKSIRERDEEYILRQLRRDKSRTQRRRKRLSSIFGSAVGILLLMVAAIVGGLLYLGEYVVVVIGRLCRGEGLASFRSIPHGGIASDPSWGELDDIPSGARDGPCDAGMCNDRDC